MSDEFDRTRADVWALIYLTASVSEGIVRVHPDIHGIYETEEAARIVQKGMSHPSDYRICKGAWRRFTP